MSWLFSRALVEAVSPRNFSATEPCAQLSVMPTRHSFWRNGKTMDCSRFSRFGLTYAPLTQDRGEALLTAWLEVSRAKTSALPAPAMGSKVSALDSGEKWRGWFAKWNPASCEWRTPQFSLLEDSELFSETWPRSGSMRGGTCYLLPTLAPLICVNAFGSLLPTLTVCGNYNAKGASKNSGDGLATALGRLPTLVARDYRSPGRSRMERTGSLAGDHLPNSIGGPLNPDWCEWFMGWPVGWTASSALATDKYQEWRQQHGVC